jgi:hypothetical protein
LSAATETPRMTIMMTTMMIFEEATIWRSSHFATQQ